MGSSASVESPISPSISSSNYYFKEDSPEKNVAGLGDKVLRSPSDSSKKTVDTTPSDPIRRDSSASWFERQCSIPILSLSGKSAGLTTEAIAEVEKTVRVTDHIHDSSVEFSEVFKYADNKDLMRLFNSSKRSLNTHKIEETAGMHVLIVDDVTLSRKMVERNLTKVEVICDHATNGREAVAKVQETLSDASKQQYDCILMDYHMPEMNGPEAIVTIRKLGFTGFIVALSGISAEDSEFSELLKSDLIDGIMTKPFNLKTFMGIVNKD